MSPSHNVDNKVKEEQQSNGHHITQPDIEEKFIDVGGVSTHVLKIGQLEDQNGLNQKYLFLIIPGNPGIPTFYEDFMQELYKQGGHRIPVWAVAHAGHSQPPAESLALSDVLSTDESRYGLDAQVKHKATFIEENIPPDVKLILVGHSIGCYFILNCLDQLTHHKVHRCFFLFPTIERMAVSPNGINLTPVFRYFRYIIVFIAFLLVTLLPVRIRQAIIRFKYRNTDYPVCMKPAILKTLTPWTVNFSTYLARIEMNRVTELQQNLVRKHLDKLSLYYGAYDLWCPLTYYEEMIGKFPDIDARVCELNMKHAFVMVRREGKKMAHIVWQWLEQQYLPKPFLKEIGMNGHDKYD